METPKIISALFKPAVSPSENTDIKKISELPEAIVRLITNTFAKIMATPAFWYSLAIAVPLMIEDPSEPIGIKVAKPVMFAAYGTAMLALNIVGEGEERKSEEIEVA